MKAHRNHTSSSLRHRRAPPKGALLLILLLLGFGASMVVIALVFRSRTAGMQSAAMGDQSHDAPATDAPGAAVLQSGHAAKGVDAAGQQPQQPPSDEVVVETDDEGHQLHRKIADIQRDNSIAVPDKIQKMRDLIESSVEAHRLQMLEQQKTLHGGNGGGDMHEMREAKVVDMIDRLRKGARRLESKEANDDQGGGNGLRSLNVDEEVARSIAAHRERFEKFQEAHHLRLAMDDDDHHRLERRTLDADRVNAGVKGTENQPPEHRASLEELRRTAFGLGGVAARPIGGNTRGGDDEGTEAPHVAPSSELRLVIMTTLKDCINASIRYAQLDAVMSWVALPIFPAPVVVLMVAGGNDDDEVECSAWVADRVNRRHAEVLGASHAATPSVRVVTDAKKGASGRTILLGAAMEQLAMLEPDADVYGLVNGDILLDPMASVALHRVAAQYTDYFVVGRRTSVSIPLSRRASVAANELHTHGGADGAAVTVGADDAASQLDFALPGWSSDALFQHTVADRQDAEDFFFWSNGFFDGETKKRKKHLATASRPHPFENKPTAAIPNFHIGRPAYDNWLVHHAIHTWQPVIDASELLVAFHQSHNYQHLLHHQQEQGGNAASGVGGHGRREPQGDAAAAAAKRAAAASYWGGLDQQENYNLGLSNGGWQHGMVDYAPLGFEPRGCADTIRQLAQQQNRHLNHDFSRNGGGGGNAQQRLREEKGKRLFDWFAYTVADAFRLGHRQPHRSAGECTLRLRQDSGWKPFVDDTPLPQRREAYDAQYQSFETQER